MTKYNKLVRDNIPRILESKNIDYKAHVASDAEYSKKLEEKLLEEVGEFIRDSTIEELADVLEVVYAFCDLYKIDKNKLEQIRKEKAEERGGFKDKIILDES